MITQPHQPRRRPSKSIEWRLVLWGGLGGLVLSCLLLGLGLIFRNGQGAPAATPVLTVFSGPTSTNTPAEVTATMAPTQTSSPPPSSTELAVGSYVTVSGTEGDGLRMRDGPSLEGTIMRLAVENEVFQIQEGPVETDGYTWWYVVNPYDPDVSGWVVGNYLRLVEED